MKRPILWITIGFITGIILGLYINIAPLIFLLLLIFTIFFGIVDYRSNNKYLRIVKILIKNNMILTYLISALVGSIYLAIYNKNFETFYNKFSNNEIISTVISNNKESEYKNTYKIRLEGFKELESVNLILRISKSKKINLNYGDKIKVSGKYIIPEGARNYGEFNYKEYLKTQKIYGIYEANKIEILKHNNLNFIELFSNKVKFKIIDSFKVVLPESTNQLFLGILIGYDDNLSENIQESFRKSSLTHLLAVSGAHIVYIITGLKFLFEKLKVPKRITNIITIMFLIFFMYLTDFSSSVVRASIMGIILIVSLILFRKNDIITTISISILLILIENPYKILDIGLLLSYLATIGIICFSKLKKNRKQDQTIKEKIIEYIKDMILITITANIFVFPIMVYNFNTISLTFVISNLIAGILIGPITIIGFILIIISFISLKFTYILSIPYNLLLELLIQSTNLISLIPLSEILVPTPNVIIILSYYISLFFYLLYIYFTKEYSNRYLTKKVSNYIMRILYYIKRNCKLIIVFTIILIILFVLVLKVIPKNLKIYFIDVGQGDSTLIITPTNKKVLIDSGGSETGNFDIGKNTIVPYLLDRGIVSLDYICISHFDSDHCDGFKYLLNNIKVKNIIISKQCKVTENFEQIMYLVNKKKTNIIKVEAGKNLNIDRYVKLKIFSPGEVLVNDINDNSIVMQLEYNKFSCLFTGDISKKIEQNLVKKYGNFLKSDVLKVSHHGSKNSSDEKFIKIVNPKISLIGVGKNNKFGHPNENVLKVLYDINSKVLRTDKNGEIIIRVDRNGNIKINTHIKQFV